MQRIALTLAALGLAPGAAHLMEMPVKLGYTAAMYADVTSTLYAWYGLAGGTVQMAAALVVAILAYRSRRLPSRRIAAASAMALVASLLIWGLAVAPVNSAWAQASHANPAEFAAAYERLRPRWEFGHLAAFIAWLIGWFMLVTAVTRPHRRDTNNPE